MIFLLRNKLLRKDSRVKLKDDKFGEYLIKDIRIQNHKYYFLTQNIRSGQLKRVPQEYIISIDDMNIDRIIDAYNYDEEVKTIEIDFETGNILEITITKNKYLFGFGETKLNIPWKKIEKIGGEVIIVNVSNE